VLSAYILNAPMKAMFRLSIAALAFCVPTFLAGCSGSSNSSSGSPQPPAATAPSISAIAPATVPAGASALTLTVTGTGFQSGTTLQIGGAAVQATYVSPTELTATVPASVLTNGAYLSVVAANGSAASPSGTSSIKLEVDNPSPTVTGFSPMSVATGASVAVVSVTGTGFIPGTTMQVNGSARATTYTSSTQVSVAMTSADFANAGSVSLVAVNPTPGGGTSAAASLPVVNPAPGAISISPSTLPIGVTAPTTITVTGSNFLGTSVAQINGAMRPTKVISGTQLTFQLTASDQASAGKAAITVSTPSPGGGTSAAATLSLVSSSAPVITMVAPMSFTLNTADNITVVGSNLSSTSVILWNGSPLMTTYNTDPYYGTYLEGVVPASLLSATGTATVTVSTPTGTSSDVFTVSITDPSVPVLSAIAPAGAPIGADATVTLTGTGFASGSTVQFDSTLLASTVVSTTSITVTVPASLLVLPGNHTFTVTTPAPGGGTSNAVAFTAYIGIANNAMALNPVNGLLYISVPSTAAAPYGNSVVSVDPATGAIGTPIPVGSEPDKLAISSDGTTLWVGLDGASAIRRVNLTTSVAGMQFSLGDNVGTYDYPPFVHAIAVLPGTTDSIVASVTTNNGLYEDLLTIFDSGVARPNTISLSAISSLPAIFVNPTKPEVYATSFESGYQVLSYNSTGLSPLAGNTGSSNFSAPYGTALQVDNGRAYLDQGIVLDAEAETLLGTFYTSGTTVAIGPMVSDSTLGRNFILESTTNFVGGASAVTQIQAFDESTFVPIASSVIPVGGALSGSKYGSGSSTETELNGYNNIDTLVRWGGNGLAFRAANGVFSFRSNSVRDLSSVNADLGVTTTASPTAATGTNVVVSSTVGNNGPSAATSAVFTETIPSNTMLVSVTSSQGNCTAASTIQCNLGTMSSGASATVSLTLKAMTAGMATVTTIVAADQNDAAGGNNTSSASVTLTGNDYAAVPLVTTLSPNAAMAGSTDVNVTVTGTNFVTNSTVYLDSTPLNTTYGSATQLTAILPTSQLTTLGWSGLSVVNPAPGGGSSNALPFSVYQVVNLTANHLLYDPYARLLYASVNSAATQVTGNTIVTIDPATGFLGAPVNVGSQPSSMALTQDGQYLYINQTGASTVGRFNTLTHSLEFSFPITLSGINSGTTVMLNDIATMPGTDNTIAVDTGAQAGIGLWDVNPTQQTGTLRGSTTGTYTGSSLQFLNANALFSYDGYTSGNLFYSYGVSSAGLSGSYNTQYTLNNFSPFKIRNGLAYANLGGVADPTVTPVEQLGVFQTVAPAGLFGADFNYGQVTEPDPSLGHSFFASLGTSGTGIVAASLETFDQTSYTATGQVTLPALTENLSGGPATPIDFVRWGQDGLALLTSTGQIVLLRGPFVVPQLLQTNTAAMLTSSSSTALSRGSGNTILTLTGSNFLPGVAALWNGSYRTTTIVDSTHISVAIPASDLTNAGSVTITAANPGAAASNIISLSVN
jgi:trimeric autotransporter adhesin